MIRRNRIIAALLVAAVCIFSAVAAVAEEKKPSATVSITSTKIAIGIGVSWGNGVLKFKGKEYKFKVHGLSVVDLGVSSVSAVGNVYNLNDLSDFAGTYTAASAGVAVGGGAGAAVMENQNGVVINLTSTKQGVQFTLSADGMKVKLVE